MLVSQETTSRINAIREFSGEKILHADDLAALVELSRIHQHVQVLDDLGFLAKFLVKTSGVMKRIGTKGEGFDKLSREFTDNLEKATTLVRLLIKEGPEELKKHFTSTYFALTPHALDSLMELFYDLSWLKNWEIDHRTGAG